MIATAKPPRDEESVCQRVTIANAARLAFPKLSQGALARALGYNRSTLRFYLSGQVKAFKIEPRWKPRFFHGCHALAYGDKKLAAAYFRTLALELDREP